MNKQKHRKPNRLKPVLGEVHTLLLELILGSFKLRLLGKRRKPGRSIPKSIRLE